MCARSSALVIGMSLLILSGVAWCVEPLATITVEAGQYARTDTPVSVPLATVPQAVAGQPLSLQEVRGADRVAVPGQVEPGPAPRLHWIIAGTLPAGQTRVYELVAGEARVDRVVKAIKDEKNLEISVGDAKVMQYHHAAAPAPKGVAKVPDSKLPLYDHSAFIHPLWSPKGTVLTDINPPDHLHHMGIWMPWTHTTFEGKMVDFWNVGDGTGTVRFSKYVSTTTGSVYGGFQSEQDHIALKTSKGEQTILKEVWDVRVYNVGGFEKGYWLVDFQSTQRCVADQPLIQDEYRYGGLGYRATRQWKGPDADYLTSEGKTRKDGHATRARWCDCFGKASDAWERLTSSAIPRTSSILSDASLARAHQLYLLQLLPIAIGRVGDETGRRPRVPLSLVRPRGQARCRPDRADLERLRESAAGENRVGPAPQAAVLSNDFSQWQREGGGEIQWKLADGVMQSVPKTGSIMTKRDYTDFMMHAEFKTPQMPDNVKGQGRGNSGIYIQRRYELQILDSYGLEPKNNECGAIYTFRAPDKNVCKKPGGWQTYDILFLRPAGRTRTASPRRCRTPGSRSTRTAC